MSKPRLLVVGDAVTATGFARVTHSILSRLAGSYEIHHLGTNFLGDPHDESWKIYPSRTEGDLYGVRRLGALIERLRPRLVFLVNDLPVLAKYMPVLARYRPQLGIVVYFPIDAGPVEPEWVEPLLPHVDRWVTYTHFAAAEILRAMAQVHGRRPEPPPEVGILPHGIDPRRFRPLAGAAEAADPRHRRRLARQALFAGRDDLLDAFIVLNANRNQPRKRIDTTIEGFSLFARDKPENVKLYLHMAREDAGWDIQILARRFGIADRLLVTRADNRFPDTELADLNLLYNACDVGVNTSSAEGWGLVSFEHAATGAAQIVPRHTSQIELWDGAAVFLEPRFLVTAEKTLTDSYLVAPEDLADALERLYADPSYRQEMAGAALCNVLQPAYDWDAIAGRWDVVFRELLDAPEATREVARAAA